MPSLMRPRSRAARIVCASAWVLATGVAAASGQVAAPRHAEAIDLCRDALEQVQREMGGAALQVAVAVDGEIVWSEAFGFADIELRAHATNLLRERAGSGN